MQQTANRPKPTGREITFGEEEIIVSKTDLKGIITYANPVFLRVAGYRESEILGQPHNIIRHPDMPRCVFGLLWTQLKAGKEIFAYVKNMASNGDHYWVHAHVTPTFDASGAITNFHSNRRWPTPRAVAAIEPIYARLRQEEQRHANARQATEAGGKLLALLLEEAGMGNAGTGRSRPGAGGGERMPYDEFVWSL
ncbi:MAG: PAS domain-containing protein [Bryobacteraceae bacterium]